MAATSSTRWESADGQDVLIRVKGGWVREYVDPEDGPVTTDIGNREAAEWFLRSGLPLPGGQSWDNLLVKGYDSLHHGLGLWILATHPGKKPTELAVLTEPQAAAWCIRVGVPLPAELSSASVSGRTPSGAKRSREDLENQAIACLMNPEIDPNVSRIADIIGVRRTTLKGWKTFDTRYNQLKQLYRASKKRIPRGFAGRDAEGRPDVDGYEGSREINQDD